MYDLAIVGAGPAGIGLAVEAVHAGIPTANIILFEKAKTHSWTIRRYYPDRKLVTANYKKMAAKCEGLLCIQDMSKSEMLALLEQYVHQYTLQVHFNEGVSDIRRLESGNFEITTQKATYTARICAVAIGIFGRPRQPDYPLPRTLKSRIFFDASELTVRNVDVLVVGGGDSASEYVQHLAALGNHVTLSYRGAHFWRMNPQNLRKLEALERAGHVEILRGSNILKIEVMDSRPMAIFAEHAYAPHCFDYIVYALGGSTPQAFLRRMGIHFADDAPHLGDGCESNIPGLFLVGDLAAGKRGGSIISAFNSSRRAMEKICDVYLGCRVRPVA